jgi:peptidoglycan/LPS O-acetylase OafA/YrhL
VWAIESRGTWIGRILNFPAFVWADTLSYSLYLWQEPFLNPEAHNWTTLFPTNLALTLFAAGFSYWLVERPFLCLKLRSSYVAQK